VSDGKGVIRSEERVNKGSSSSRRWKQTNGCRGRDETEERQRLRE
jgi:hypothetical protein